MIISSPKKLVQAVAIFASTLLPIVAEETLPQANLADFEKIIAPLFAKSCFDCHGPRNSKGRFRADKLNPDLLTGGDIDRWVEVYDVLSQSEMPPDDEPDYHLEEKDRGRIIDWIGAEMKKAALVRRNAGAHGSFRHMANYEYNHALQDLLGLNLNFADALPPDNASEDGFKNSSKFLRMSSMQFETYREIALSALEKATVEGERPEVVTWQIPMQEAMDKAAALKPKAISRDDPGYKNKKRSTHIFNKQTGEGFLYRWTYYVVLDRAHYGIWNLKPDKLINPAPAVSDVVAVIPPSRKIRLDLGNSLPDEGMMRVKLRVGASTREAGQSASLRLVFGFQTNNEGKMSAKVSQRDVEVTTSVDEPGFYIFEVPLDEIPRNPFRKKHEIGQAPNCTEYLEIHNISRTGQRGEGEPVNLELDYAEVEAGLYKNWPPKSHTAIFFESPNQNDEDQYCREILQRFMTRAWRRPITKEDVAPYSKLFKNYRPGFSGFQQTMIEVLATVLASPEFLYLIQTESEKSSDTRSISNLELANRLSFFLWSSIPDDELLKLAFSKKLKSPNILDAQVARMLTDPKSQRFTRHFVEQWLGLDSIKNLVVDQKKFPTYDQDFQGILLREPLAFFDHVLQNNASVMDFLQSDYLVIDENLARHYGLSDVRGQDFRKVTISSDINRGGLFTTAAVLTMNSTGVDSNPLKRGVWLLENMLHDPPPPPPPNVPEVDLTDPRILSMTPKERMADHRNQAACRSCHAKIDPWGLALENYDAIGRFRTTIKDKPIDATAVLYNNESLNGVAGLKDYLMTKRQDQFAKAMVHKMTSYALGRPLSFADRAEIEMMATKLRSNGDGLKDLVSIIIHSKLFRTKITKEDENE